MDVFKKLTQTFVLVISDKLFILIILKIHYLAIKYAVGFVPINTVLSMKLTRVYMIRISQFADAIPKGHGPKKFTLIDRYR